MPDLSSEHETSLAPTTTWHEYHLLILSGAVGIAGGLGARVFTWLLNSAQQLLLVGIAGYIPPQPGTANPEPVVGPWGLWLIPLVTALGGLLSGFLSQTFAPEAEGEGTDSAVDAYHHKGGKVSPKVPLVKAIASAITIGSGGAAGREGPAAQISVGMGSIMADVLRLPNEERRMLVLAGMAAGLAAMFKAPLSMAIFAVEVLYGGMALESEAMIYTVTAAVIAYAVNGLFAGWEPIFFFPETLHFSHPSELIGYGVLGIVAGLVGAIEPTIYYRIRDVFKKLRAPLYIKPAIGGLLMGLLALIVPETISTGYGWVQKAMTGGYVGWSLILLAMAEIVAVSLTITSGGSGGIFGPNVYIGGMIGTWVAFALDKLLPIAHFSPSAFAAVGMAAVFGGAARVPIATLVMVAEMTGGYGLIVPSMLATSMAFVVQRMVTARARYPRILEAQVELRKDSPTHHESLVRAAFQVLTTSPAMDFQGLTLPELEDLLAHGIPFPIHNGKGKLLMFDVPAGSLTAGKTVADTFADVRDVIVVAIVREASLLLPRGSTCIEAGDRLLLATSEGDQDTIRSRLAQNS